MDFTFSWEFLYSPLNGGEYSRTATYPSIRTAIGPGASARRRRRDARVEETSGSDDADQ